MVLGRFSRWFNAPVTPKPIRIRAIRRKKSVHPKSLGSFGCPDEFGFVVGERLYRWNRARCLMAFPRRSHSFSRLLFPNALADVFWFCLLCRLLRSRNDLSGWPDRRLWLWQQRLQSRDKLITSQADRVLRN